MVCALLCHTCHWHHAGEGLKIGGLLGICLEDSRAFLQCVPWPILELPSLHLHLSSSNVKESESDSRSVVSNSLWPHELHSPWNSPGQNTGVDSLFLLQGIFPTQGSNPGLPHCRVFLYQLSHKGSPRLLEWVAYPFSSGSSWPRNQTRVSCMAGGFFTNWTIREAPRWIFFISR